MTSPSDSTLALDARAQRLADKTLDALGNRRLLTRGAALGALTEYLDEEGRLVEHTVDQRNWIFAPDPEELVRRVVESTEGDVESSAARQQLVLLAREAFAGGAEYWGDEPTGPIVAAIQHTNGANGYLLYSIDCYGHGPYRWHGLFADRAGAEQFVRNWGRLMNQSEFDDVLDALVEQVLEGGE